MMDGKVTAFKFVSLKLFQRIEGSFGLCIALYTVLQLGKPTVMAYMSRENWDFTSRDNMQWNYKAAIAFS
jgi:hypothetical protein